ncbi:virion structural protein [Bacillus phage Shbh1]|uniref:Uncharacterized protein n=1 Tax=Bacillus phage Shbh1 TaxID=1796992 RepID=A0A142F1D9_9CAUD|nr:virion structural protein [Bacillus phage Shbh1]AMQ66596.1 hypothetical protein [Bacillus phage Shbh1]
MPDQPSFLNNMSNNTDVNLSTNRPSTNHGMPKGYIRPDLVEAHNDTFHIPTLWEKSYLCPCRERSTRQPKQTCNICFGRGIAFLPSQPLKITIQSQEKGINNIDLGLLDSGTAIGTPERLTRLTFRDRITIPEAVIGQSLLFDIDENRLNNGFYLIYDVKSITFATTTKGQIYEGEDFEIDYNKNLFLPKESLLGENVSINLLTTLRYLVADLLKEHRYIQEPNQTFTLSPQKILLKREDVFIEKESWALGASNEEVNKMIDTKRPSEPDGLNGFFRNGVL